MKQQAYFTAFLLVGLVSTAPTSRESDDFKMIFSEEFFNDKLLVYTADYDIVNLLLPLNALNFEGDAIYYVGDVDSEVIIRTVLFFTLADDENGQRVYKGLYVFKDGEVKKILDNGRDAASASENTYDVFFGATDGIYLYNNEENTAEKYGTITDSVISIAKVTGDDIIYILTDDYVLYKVTEEGTKKEVIEEAVNAQKIVLDYENNLYYYTADKKVYVMNSEGVKQVEGLPDEISYIDILRPPFLMQDSIPVIIDDKAYVASSNGTSELSDLELKVKPSAYSMEATILQYIAYNKKIYEYNILTLLYSDVSQDIQIYVENKFESMTKIANFVRKK